MSNKHCPLLSKLVAKKTDANRVKEKKREREREDVVKVTTVETVCASQSETTI